MSWIKLKLARHRWKAAKRLSDAEMLSVRAKDILGHLTP